MASVGADPPPLHAPGRGPGAFARALHRSAGSVVRPRRVLPGPPPALPRSIHPVVGVPRGAQAWSVPPTRGSAGAGRAVPRPPRLSHRLVSVLRPRLPSDGAASTAVGVGTSRRPPPQLRAPSDPPRRRAAAAPTPRATSGRPRPPTASGPGLAARAGGLRILGGDHGRDEHRARAVGARVRSPGRPREQPVASRPGRAVPDGGAAPAVPAASLSRAERFTAAAARRPLEPPRPLPRALQAVAREVGVEPAGVRMTSGPATRAALRAARAPGASQGSTLHLRSTSASAPADREVAAHELAHAAARGAPQRVAHGPSTPPAVRSGGDRAPSAVARPSPSPTPTTVASAAGLHRLPRAPAGPAPAAAVRVPATRTVGAGRTRPTTPPSSAGASGATTARRPAAPGPTAPSGPTAGRPAPPAVRFFGGSGHADPEETVARMVGRAGRGATGASAPAGSADDALPVAGRGLGASAVREMVATAVAEQLDQAEPAAATPGTPADAGGPAAAPRGGRAAAPAPTAGPSAAADGPAAAPDVDAIVEQLEERLLTEIERRGGRYQGVF